MDASAFQSKFSKRILTKDSLTILSATDNGETFGPGTANGTALDGLSGTISVYTERLAFEPAKDDTTSAFSSSSASLMTLCTTQLSVKEGSPNALVALRGGKGVPNDAGTAAGLNATNGGKGRDIRIFLGSVAPEAIRLGLDVRGGDGATTTDQDTPAGSGGSGGTIEVVGLSTFASLYESLQDFQETVTLPEDWTPEEAKAGEPLGRDSEIFTRGQALANLATKVCSDKEPVGMKIRERLDIFLKPEPVNIYAVARAVRTSTYFIEKHLQDESTRLYKLCQVGGGLGGPATNTALKRGTNGKDGASGQVSLDFLGSTLSFKPTFIFAHPLQCQMLLEKARAYYYFGDDASLKQATKLAESALVKTRLFLQLGADSTANQIKLFEDNKKALGLESGAQALDLFRATDSAIQNMLFKLANTTLDYYSRQRNWVPRTSVSRFEEESKVALEDLKRIETLFFGYTKAVTDKKQKSDEREDVLKEVSASQGMIDFHVEEMRGVLSELRRAIVNPQKKLDIYRLNGEAEALIEKLSDTILKNFKLTPKQLLGGIKSFAAEPSKGAAVKEAGKLIWTGFTKVPNVDGVEVDKSLLLKKVGAMNGKLKDNLPDLVKDSTKDDDGFLDADGAGSSIVVATAEQIQELIEEFGGDAFGGKATEAATKLKEFITQVTQHNANIVQYNVVLKDIIDSFAKKEALDTRRNLEQKEPFKEQNVDQIASMADLSAEVHSQSRERTMRLVTLYRRSIFFSTLQDPDLLEVIGLKNDAALNLSAIKLEQIKKKLHDRLEDLREKKGSDAPRYPAKYEDEPGKFVNLSSAQLKLLLENKRLQIPIQAIRKSSRTYPDFVGRADVRVYRARFWLDGLTIRDKSTWPEDEMQSDEVPVNIGLKHCGDSVLTDVYDRPCVFTHDDIDVTWQYRLIYSATPVDNPAVGIPKPQAVDSGDVVNYSAKSKEDNTAYAAPSPFATWIVNLEYLDPRLDLSKVTRARFEFFGTSRSFK